ncbi:MAG: 2TM domain-containing protein [Nocardioides sp.]|nr:2TM domain-containing protein [Nocardioides sp.]
MNTLLVVIWATTLPGGFFWPIFPIAGWGIGLVMHAWDAFLRTEITDEDVDRELERMHHH